MKEMASKSASRPERQHSNRRLGLLDLWEFVFLTIAVANIVALLFESQHSARFAFDTYLNLADAVCAGVIFLLIAQRKNITRQLIFVYAPLMLLVGILGDLFLHNFAFSPMYFLSHGRVIFLLAWLYFFFSKKALEQLDQPFILQESGIKIAREGDLYRLRDRRFWRDVALYFMLFSIVGHWMERVYAVYMRDTGGPYDPSAPMWQSYLAPFPIYGIGAVACILLLFPLRQVLMRKLKNVFLVIFVVYLANTLVCTAIELTVGLIFNHPGPDGTLIYWDYHDRPFNFMGQICLQNALAFGAVATLMVWQFFPTIERRIVEGSNDVVNVVFVVVLVVWLLLAAFYLITLPLPPHLLPLAPS
ncbi:MAG: putative ABC transporter permease [Coriobacteriales bacterium]|jgi:uncharacterized membrane protein|nr:putative ABC transporter permease [Coriobacteriales bacterium]